MPLTGLLDPFGHSFIIGTAFIYVYPIRRTVQIISSKASDVLIDHMCAPPNHILIT